MFNFRELDLSAVKASGISNRLKPGNYVCTISEAKVEQTKSKNGYAAKVVFVADDMSGEITNYFNVAHKNEDTQRIGREQLKGLLVAAGHPNPDQPGDITSLLKLKVGVRVVEEPYMKDGQQRMGSAVAGFFAPSDYAKQAPVPLGPTTAPASGGGVSAMKDDLPF